jgi:hypothetical protein
MKKGLERGEGTFEHSKGARRVRSLIIMNHYHATNFGPTFEHR